MPSRTHPAYQIINFGVIVGIILTFSVALTPALGLVGFLIPPVLIGTAYIFVSAVLDGLIHIVQRIEGLFAFQPARHTDPHRFDYIAAPKQRPFHRLDDEAEDDDRRDGSSR